MTIDSDFLTIINLKKLERQTFKYLSDSKPLKECDEFKSFHSKAKMTYEALNAPKKFRIIPIDFQSQFDLIKEKVTWRIHIGGIIKNDYSQVTYYVAICDLGKTSTPCKIRRKFHFDYDNGEGTCRQLHPRYHVQYAGEKVPNMCGIHCDSYEDVLYPSLSEPRLPYTPMSIALLLNCIFTEFRTELTTKIAEDDKWRELIKTNEAELLKPYYGNCSRFFNGSHSSTNLFTSDYCYGK